MMWVSDTSRIGTFPTVLTVGARHFKNDSEVPIKSESVQFEVAISYT